jgi:hypothetical protein
MVPVEIAPEIGTSSPILRSAQPQLGQVHGGEWADPGGWIVTGIELFVDGGVAQI